MTPVSRSAWSLSRFFRLSSVPGSPEEVRAFLARRISIFLAASTVHWGGVALLILPTLFLTRPEVSLVADDRYRSAFLIALALGFALLTWVVRRSKLSLSQLGAADFAAVVSQGIAIAVMVVYSVPNVRFRPEFTLILALTYVLSGRAAVIPSSAGRTALLSLLASLPVCWSVYHMQRIADELGLSLRHHYSDDHSTPLTFAVWAAVFCLMSCALATFISWIIFGLQREVQNARQLGQYVLEREIGAGGMGVVYRARHALLRRPTAVKLLPPGRAGSAAIARFEREVQATSQLSHPNIVAIYDYGRTPEGVFYYAMEYLDGIDLDTLVRRDGAQPPARVRGILTQVALALAEAHAHGLIHRDVKPSNIVICKSRLAGDLIKVLDFGLVRALEQTNTELTENGEFVGTPNYMSPEQISTPERVDARTDLYALGAVGYFLLTGRAPVSGTTSLEVCAKHLYATPERPSEVLAQELSLALEGAVLGCLEKEPARRPSSAQALAETLEGLTDVPRWSAGDAAHWWVERGGAAGAEPPPAALAQTLAVDLSGRGRLPA